jgi:TolB protein
MNVYPAVTVLALCVFSACASPPPAEPSRSLPDRESPVTQVTSGRSGADKDPEISPDGKTLYYSSSSHGDTLDLYMKAIGANTSTRLTALPGDKRFPKVNPANPRILAFSTNGRGGWEIALFNVAGDPARVQYVSESGLECIHPSWSPDGSKLVYCATDDLGSGEWVLKVLDFATGKTHTFDDIDGLLPEWSPRGNTIAFQRMKRRDAWHSELWTAEFEVGSMRNLTAVFSSDDWAAINPSWSPDGRRIAFATVGKSRSRTGVLHEGDDIWVIGADGSNPTRLTTSPSAEGMPAWSVDGTVYFTSNRSGSTRIWSLKPNVSGSPEGGY